jgi:UDP-N-acetylmuramate dehydrogenase
MCIRDRNSNLVLAEILHRTQGKQTWDCAQMQYSYRSSALKRSPGEAVILSARLKLNQSTQEEVQARMDEFNARRRRSQPPGASLGSMFKNPPNEYAGRLIEAAGLKGARIGGAQISTIHANFFVNDQNATAQDLQQLIELAQQRVFEKFGIQLELEVEWLGIWQQKNGQSANTLHNKGNQNG